MREAVRIVPRVVVVAVVAPAEVAVAVVAVAAVVVAAVAHLLGGSHNGIADQIE